MNLIALGIKNKLNLVYNIINPISDIVFNTSSCIEEKEHLEDLIITLLENYYIYDISVTIDKTDEK